MAYLNKITIGDLLADIKYLLQFFVRPPWISQTTSAIIVNNPTTANLLATVTIASSQTLATVTAVTTVADITRLNSLGNSTSNFPADKLVDGRDRWIYQINNRIY